MAKDNGNSLDLSDAEIKKQVKAGISANIDNWKAFIGWCRWYPDLWFDLVKPSTGGICLHPDQRVQLRVMARFQSVYGVAERGSGKTFIEFLNNVHACIFYPGIEISIASSTRENSAAIMADKWSDVIKKYPIITNEVKKVKFSKNEAEILFVNDSRMTNIANSQQSKGLRRNRIVIEESALLNESVFDDALRPIASEPRRTVGNAGVDSPEEMQRVIDFFSTTGYKQSYEFTRNQLMLRNMAECNGDFVFGSGWATPCWYGRSYGIEDLERYKKTSSPIFFQQNYESRWTGVSANGLVDMVKLLSLQTLDKAEFKTDGKSEYILAMDVARSQKAGKCQSSVAVLKMERSSNHRIRRLPLVNLTTISGEENFTSQAITIKKIYNDFLPNCVVIDGNGLGRGLVDELAREQEDPETGEILPCWQSFNTELQTEKPDAVRCMYMLIQTEKIPGTNLSANSDAIAKFMEVVDTGKLQLLNADAGANIGSEDLEYSKDERLPFIHTKFFIDEVSNLKMKVLPNNQLKIEQAVASVPKDRFSAVEYAIWYAMRFEDFVENENDESVLGYIWIG